MSLKLITMITNLEDFLKARTLAEDISLGNTKDIKAAIEDVGKNIIDLRTKKEFYDYLGSLLLNTVLNRGEELGLDAKERALEGRRIIKDIINNL